MNSKVGKRQNGVRNARNGACERVKEQALRQCWEDGKGGKSIDRRKISIIRFVLVEPQWGRGLDREVLILAESVLRGEIEECGREDNGVSVSIELKF